MKKTKMTIYLNANRTYLWRVPQSKFWEWIISRYIEVQLWDNQEQHWSLEINADAIKAKDLGDMHI